jgi:hypothetical protein
MFSGTATQPAANADPVVSLIMRLLAPHAMSNDRLAAAHRTPSRQQMQRDRDYPGSVLSSPSGSAIKRNQGWREGPPFSTPCQGSIGPRAFTLRKSHFRTKKEYRFLTAAACPAQLQYWPVKGRQSLISLVRGGIGESDTAGKKSLSLAKDRCNVYGEAPHGARKSIPLRKKLRNRANRHNQESKLPSAPASFDAVEADEIDSSMYDKAPQRWSKSPDAPLGSVIAKKTTPAGDFKPDRIRAVVAKSSRP